jgi:hypothetical protein
MRFEILKGIPMRRTPVLTLALAAGMVACSDSSGPDTGGVKPPGDLTIIRLPAGSPPIWNPVDSFYAKKGTDREVRIYFMTPGDTSRGEEYLRLRVDSPSLLSYPDGTLFQVGDSVLITVRVVDPEQIYFEFEPSGLRFNPSVPAELKIEYAETEGDLDDDGDVDGDDDAIEQVIDLWRQEQIGQDFVKLGAVKIEELDEIEADILGFTRYAIAY